MFVIHDFSNLMIKLNKQLEWSFVPWNAFILISIASVLHNSLLKYQNFHSPNEIGLFMFQMSLSPKLKIPYQLWRLIFSHFCVPPLPLKVQNYVIGYTLEKKKNQTAKNHQLVLWAFIALIDCIYVCPNVRSLIKPKIIFSSMREPALRRWLLA